MKAQSPIEATDDEPSNNTFSSDEHSAKVHFPIEVNEEGIVICLSDVHL